jgi:hypothetical protein
MNLRICAGSLSERLNKEPLTRHLVQLLEGKQRRPVMVKPHVLLMSSLILNTWMAVSCASGFMEPASTPPAETYQHLSDQAVLYRQEAVDLRAAAQYYEGKAQRSAWETGQDSDRTQRYRDFAQQASVQALEADRHAEEYQQQLL